MCFTLSKIWPCSTATSKTRSSSWSMADCARSASSRRVALAGMGCSAASDLLDVLGPVDLRDAPDRVAGADVGIGQVSPFRITYRGDHTCLVVKAAADGLDRPDEVVQRRSHCVGR